MADNVSIDQDGVGGVDFVAATDEVAGNHYQKVKLVDGTADSVAVIPGDATSGLWVNVKAIAASSKVQLTDGTSDATVRNLAANDALNVAIVDAAGNQITTFGGSGGTAIADDADFVAGTTIGTPVQGVYESTPTSVTDGDAGWIGIDTNRRVKVTVDASTIDVAHDAADSGNPVKIGGKALTATPTAVATGDRTNANFTTLGQMWTAHIDPAMQVAKNLTYTSTQTGTDVWTPASGKKIAVTSVIIGSYGTTAGRIILWFGDNADTTFTQNTDQVVFAGSFAPSATVTPGAVFTPAVPIFCNTADRELHVTTATALSFDLTVYGYEF